MKVVTREQWLFVLIEWMKGFFIYPLSFRYSWKTNNCIWKSCEGTSNGVVVHSESERLVESSYTYSVKKILELREEIVIAKVDLCRLASVIGLVQGTSQIF